MVMLVSRGFKAERFAADSLRGDRRIVLAAVSQAGASIHFCKLFVSSEAILKCSSVALLVPSYSFLFRAQSLRMAMPCDTHA